MDIAAIGVIAVATAIIAKVIQSTNRDLAAALSITAVVIIAISFMHPLQEVLNAILNDAESAGINHEYIQTAIKVLGVCYICELSSSSCRDCGENALGSAVDLSGKIAIGLICVPLIESLISVVKNILTM